MFDRIFSEIAGLSAEGGWIFWGLIALAFGIAFALISLGQSLRLADTPILAPGDWRALLGSPEPSASLVVRLREALPRANAAGALEEIEHGLFDTAARRFPFAFTLIGAAPLLGLLGTVAGMLAMFSGMAAASISTPVDGISEGVSEALITTQTGLVIGVPSFISCSLLRNRFDRLRLAYRRLASVLLQETDS